MGKFKQWIVAHKVWSIVIASVLVVAIALSIALPLALKDRTMYTVDDTTLANALQFKDAEGEAYTNWQAECVNNRTNKAYYWVKYTGDYYYAYNENGVPQGVSYINYYDGENPVRTIYKKNKDEGWTKTEATGHVSDLGGLAASCLRLTNLSSFEFEYKEADKAYCYTREVGISTTTYKSERTYKLFFENGKLVGYRNILTRIYFASETEEEKFIVLDDNTWSISYGNATVEIPDLSYVGESQWTKALSFDGVTNYTMSSQGGVNSQVINMTSARARRVTTNAAGKTDIVVLDTVSHNKYNKDFSSEKFTVTNISSLDANYITLYIGNPADRYSNILSIFADFAYRADEKVFYKESVKIGTSDVTNVKLTFDNGKLIKCEYDNTDGSGNSYTIIITYTYGDAVVTIPSDSECITPIANNSGSFTLSNVTLKANETRTFVIDITQDYFDANSEGGKCTIDGTFTATTSATFDKIVVRNASGTIIDNSSSDNGGLNCEISTFGKYYIEIKATSGDCTGNWNIGFAG